MQCARKILGAQAQVESCALHALSMRTAPDADGHRPTAAALTALIAEGTHPLVRTWGQRGTLHLYDQRDLPLMNAGSQAWATSGRRGGFPDEAVVAQMAEVFEAHGGPMTRADLIPHIPEAYVDTLTDHPAVQGKPAHFAATRLIWCLARRGDIVFARKQGSTQAYVHRRHWCPDLKWAPYGVFEAHGRIGLRYLSAFGPASLRDIAYHLGAKISEVRKWGKAFAGEVVWCRCGDRSELMVLRPDVEALQAPVGPWPTRLLPAYDTALMGHKDKGLILPNAAEESLVWKRAAVVSATVIAEGQIAATWSHKKKGKTVSVTVSPLSLWRDSLMPEVEAEAQAFAHHLGLTLSAVDITR